LGGGRFEIDRRRAVRPVAEINVEILELRRPVAGEVGFDDRRPAVKPVRVC